MYSVSTPNAPAYQSSLPQTIPLFGLHEINGLPSSSASMYPLSTHLMVQSQNSFKLVSKNPIAEVGAGIRQLAENSWTVGAQALRWSFSVIDRFANLLTLNLIPGAEAAPIAMSEFQPNLQQSVIDVFNEKKIITYQGCYSAFNTLSVTEKSNLSNLHKKEFDNYLSAKRKLAGFQNFIINLMADNVQVEQDWLHTCTNKLYSIAQLTLMSEELSSTPEQWLLDERNQGTYHLDLKACTLRLNGEELVLVPAPSLANRNEQCGYGPYMKYLEDALSSHADILVIWNMNLVEQFTLELFLKFFSTQSVETLINGIDQVQTNIEDDLKPKIRMQLRQTAVEDHRALEQSATRFRHKISKAVAKHPKKTEATEKTVDLDTPDQIYPDLKKFAVLSTNTTTEMKMINMEDKLSSNKDELISNKWMVALNVEQQATSWLLEEKRGWFINHKKVGHTFKLDDEKFKSQQSFPIITFITYKNSPATLKLLGCSLVEVNPELTYDFVRCLVTQAAKDYVHRLLEDSPGYNRVYRFMGGDSALENWVIEFEQLAKGKIDEWFKNDNPKTNKPKEDL